MDKRVRAEVIHRLTEYPLFEKGALAFVISKDLNINTGDVLRSIGFMEDEGEIETVLENNVRLTFKPPLLVRFGRYMAINWIAIVALVISFIGIVISLRPF